jgi:hypothetical protein
MFPRYLGTRITSQSFIKQTINGSAVSSTKVVLPEPVSVFRNIPWYLSEVLHTDGTDIIAQVSQTCYHPVTKTPGNCICLSLTITSLIRCTTPEVTPALTLVHLEQLLSVPAAKLQCKIHPRVKALFQHNL